MPKIPLSSFGKVVKKRLIDVECNQIWLIVKVREDTGLYFDDSYLHKILTGRIATPSIINSICKILEIEKPHEDKQSA